MAIGGVKYLLPFMALWLLSASCAPCRQLPEAVRYRDSTVVRYVDSTVVNVRDSVVLVSIPVESSMAVVPRDYSSHLETSVAESDVWVDDGGFLHHNIRNKPEKLPVVVPIYDKARTITSMSGHDGELLRTVEVPVPAELTWWQRFRIKSFWWLILIALVGWRRELLALLKLIIKLFA